MADQNYIFISYKGADPEALALIGQLRSRGYRIWCDRSIQGGANWLQSIAEQLSGCRCMISLLTEAYLDSEWCMRELLTAQALGKPVTPVITASSLTMPLRLATERYPDAVRRDAFDTEEAFFRALTQAEGVSDCYAGASAAPAPLDLDEAAAEVPASRSLGISCEVKMLGTDVWYPMIKARLGDTVRFRVHVVNQGDILLENLHVRDIFPTGLAYVPGSATIANSTNPKGIAVSDRLIEDSGMNLGSYAPRGALWLYFNATVTPGAYARGTNVILRNIIQSSAGRITGTVESYADVLVDYPI